MAPTHFLVSSTFRLFRLSVSQPSARGAGRRGAGKGLLELVGGENASEPSLTATTAASPPRPVALRRDHSLATDSHQLLEQGKQGGEGGEVGRAGRDEG